MNKIDILSFVLESPILNYALKGLKDSLVIRASLIIEAELECWLEICP